jgi:predicted RNA-binding protein YlxR (DUF448 family)
VPRRKCVGCGRTAPKPELVRIAFADRESSRAGKGRRPAVVLDPAARMAGRGAYLCRGVSAAEPTAECLALALKRGAIPRALRCSVSLPVELVESVSS